MQEILHHLHHFVRINYNISEFKNYILTPEDFLSRKERQQLMKTSREHAEWKNFVQYVRLLHFRSANGKQGNLSSKKKNLKPQIKGVFQF